MKDENDKKKMMRDLLGVEGVLFHETKKKIEKYERFQKDIDRWSIPKDEGLKKQFENIKASIKDLIELLELHKERILIYFSYSGKEKNSMREELRHSEKKLRQLEFNLKQLITIFRVQHKKILRQDL